MLDSAGSTLVEWGRQQQQQHNNNNNDNNNNDIDNILDKYFDNDNSICTITITKINNCGNSNIVIVVITALGNRNA